MKKESNYLLFLYCALAALVIAALLCGYFWKWGQNRLEKQPPKMALNIAPPGSGSGPLNKLPMARVVALLLTKKGGS